jgi:putative transposase
MNFGSSSRFGSRHAQSENNIEQAPHPHGSHDQRWSTFTRNHARGIVACDFFVTVRVRFRILYIFVALEIGSRRLLHFNVSEHPTSEWMLKQLR